MDADYEKLRALLALQQFPHCYMHKFIGKRTPGFMASLERLEESFPRITKVSSRESVSQKDPAYLACTYELIASSPDEIIELIKATTVMTDLKVIL